MLEHRYLADPPGSGSDTLARATQQILGLFAEPEISAAVGDAAGVWFIVFPREDLNIWRMVFKHTPRLLGCPNITVWIQSPHTGSWRPTTSSDDRAKAVLVLYAIGLLVYGAAALRVESPGYMDADYYYALRSS